MILRLWSTAIGLVSLVCLLASCNDSTAPGIEPEIRNNTDSFEFQVSSMAGVNRTLEYNWSNTGTVANVNQSATFTAGSAQLVILDPAGSQLYSRSLAENGTFVTSSGPTGAWRIRVVFTNSSGTLNFRVEKRP